MILALRLLALPFLAVAVLLCYWICKRLPAGWRRNLNGLTAAIVLFTLAYFGWQETIARFTYATYVCAACGRTEDQRRFAHWTWSRELIDNGAEFQRRFPAIAAREHEHAWHLESCLYSETGSVDCTLECIEGWFRVLPRLVDHPAADDLVREAQILPRDQRFELMDEISKSVWLREKDEGGIDAAFERWRAQRRK